ncbi:MAG: DUF4157 domain-containing protein, partial [Armatimonadota bacterium]|nr:DUF4157 domain-containing protein [Armatimonadota bacterium]
MLHLSLSSQPAFVYLQLKDFFLKHLHDADRLVPAFRRDAAQYPQGALVAQVLQAQYEQVRMELLRDKPADSGELGSLQTQLMTRYHSSWTEVKEGLIGRDDAQMRRFLSFRKHFVDGEIDHLRGEYPGLLAKSVGSADLTSDYDLTLATPGSDGDVKAVAKFNKRVETVFGKQPGTVFDTNLYAKDYLGVSENISLSVKDRVTADPRLKDKAAESPGGGQSQTGALDQDVMSLLKQRRFMPQVEWDRYTEQVVDAMGEPPPTDGKALAILHKKQADVRRQYDEADALYQSSVFELLGETRKALEKSNPQALAHLTPAALDAAEALALEAEVDALLPKGGKPTISLRETLLAQLRAPKELGAMQHADADLSSKVSGELYLARMKQVRRLQLQIRDADAQALTQPGPTVPSAAKLNVLRAQVKKLLGEAIFFAAEAYQSEGALKHVVAGLQGSDEEKAQALGSLSPGEILQSFNEQLGDFLKDIGHYTHEGAPAGKIFYRSSKYLWRLFDAVNEMRTERQGAERLLLPPLKFELAYKPAPEIAGRLDKELVAIRKGVGNLDEPQKVKKSEEIVGSLFRVSSAPALQSVVLGLSQEFNSAIRQRVSFGQDKDSVRDYHQFRSAGLPTVPKGQTPAFLAAPTVRIGPKLPLPGKSRVTGQVAALNAPESQQTAAAKSPFAPSLPGAVRTNPKPLSAHSLAPFSLPSQSQSPLPLTGYSPKIGPLASTQGGTGVDRHSPPAPQNWGGGASGTGGASSVVQFQRFARGRMPDVNPAALRTHLLQIGGRGAAPDSGLRQALAPQLGFDPGGARLHTGPAAAEAARWLQAEAFTIGRDVFFGAQRFDPSSPRGRGLIGHELTHVGQQTGMIGGHRRADLGTMEREAQQVGERILARPSARGGLQVGNYQCRYEAVGQDDLDNDELARLERISQEALRRAGAVLGRRGTSLLDLGSAAIDIEIDLDQMTDREAAQVWADAIVALFGPEVHAEAATPTANAIQRQLTFDSSWPKEDVAGPTHVQVLQGRMSDMNAAFKPLEKIMDELGPASALLHGLTDSALYDRWDSLSKFVTAAKQTPVTFDEWRTRLQTIRAQVRLAQALLREARPFIRFFTPYFANQAQFALAKEVYRELPDFAQTRKRLSYLLPFSDRDEIFTLAKRVLVAMGNNEVLARQRMTFFQPYFATKTHLDLALEVFQNVVRIGEMKAARDWMSYVLPYAADTGQLARARTVLKQAGSYALASQWMQILIPFWGRDIVFEAVKDDLNGLLPYRGIPAAQARADYGARFYAKHLALARQVIKDVPDVDLATKRMDYLAKWHDQGTDLFQLAETALKAVAFDPVVADVRMNYLAKWHGEGTELFSLAETVLTEAAHDAAVADTRVTFLKPYVGKALI